MSFSWSYSALTSYETCPRRHYETRIAKNFQEMEGPELKWGHIVHDACEQRLKNPSHRMPEGMSEFAPIVDQIRAAPGDTLGEHRLALDENFMPCDWRRAWLRGVIDVGKKNGRKLFLGDYKTGKVHPDNDQLELFALIGFRQWLDVEEIDTAFIWLKFRQITKHRYSRKDTPGLWNKFLPRIERMKNAIEANSFEAKPSGLCRKHCPVTTCPHNGSYK